MYPYDNNKTVSVINFVEYCYSYKANMQDNFGLYLYVYNPQGLDINTETTANKVQMAVAYDNCKPTDYAKFRLEFCSVSTEPDYYRLFYKFKIVDDEGQILSRLNSNARRYDISGIELFTKGSSNATEYPVGANYTFTGYAKGYGPDVNAESTLSCNVEVMETVQFTVKHTFYRSETSSLGAGHQNQLDTVYFRVPERLIDEYGRLQRIKAEWYEYKTKEIVVTSNKDFYNAIKDYVGVTLGKEYNEDIGYSLGLNAGDGGGINSAKWGWNLGEGYLHPACQTLYYLFLVNDIEEYDPYAEITEIGGVQSNDLYEYIKVYDKTYVNGRLDVKEGNISADLFEDDIDENRKIDNENGKIQKGYSYYDFDADVDLQVLESWSSGNPSFWDTWVNFGLGQAFTGGPDEESKTVAPIQILKASDLSGSNAQVADRLLVNVNDVDSIKAEYNIAEQNDEVLVLFRFATSDYYSEAVDIMQLGEGFLWSNKHITGEAYIAQESVFLDFDIIQLTFNKEGAYTVIPVVSSPIDIVDGLTPPVDIPDELSTLEV
ncbi:MAG: hypothetical protein IKA90_03510, partial [Clostridia bacterium]|nr:hypothetical protein [Clostridia bacterium]